MAVEGGAGRDTLFLRLLQRVTAAANAAMTVDDALRVALDELCAATGWPVGHVFRPNTESDLMSVDVWHLADPHRYRGLREVTERTRLAPGHGLPGRVWLDHAPVWIPDLRVDRNFPRLRGAGDIGVRAAFGFPIVVGGEVLAVLEFFAPDVRERDDRLVDLVSSVGEQLGHVLARHRAEQALRASEARARLVVETANDAFVGMDESGRIMDWNRQAEDTFGWSREDALGRSLAETIVPPELRAAHTRGFQRFLQTGVASVMGRPIELEALDRTGRRFPIELTIWPVEVDERRSFNAFVRDITERKVFEEKLAHQAFHDALTGLANRELFRDRTSRALARNETTGRTVAVFFLDIDNFKSVNDALGHEAGDELLVAVARRLEACLRPADSVARLGGDEFVVLVEDVDDVEVAASVADRLLDVVHQPLVVRRQEVTPSVSIGIAFSTAMGASAETLIRDADIAMYAAKASGKGRHELFDQGMHARAVARLEMQAELERALDRGEFVLHFQPTIELGSGRIEGFEALVRWQHPERGLVSPATFIPLAEETGFIVALGRWVLREACREAATWPGSGGESISVNVSGRQLQDATIVDDVEQALSESGLAPRRLILEITETVLVGEAAKVSNHLSRLKALGVRLAMDDFGTGYSSLGQLSRFPVDIVKIDKMFIDSLITAPAEGSAFVRAIVALGETLNLRTTAEGVEESRQQEQLLRLGCDTAQGFLFARPLPASEAADLLRRDFFSGSTAGDGAGAAAAVA